MRGFTIVEFMIVVTLIIALAIGLLLLTDPLERIHVSNDVRMAHFAESMLTSLTAAESANGTQYDAYSFEAGALSESTPAAIISSMVQDGHMQPGFLIAEKERKKMLMTIRPPFSYISLCFVPESKQYRTMADSSKNSSGGTWTQCEQGECYYCMYGMGNDNATLFGDSCNTIDYKNPPYHMGVTLITKDPTNKMTTYGCIGFVAVDWGCDTSYCPKGYRTMHKNYSAGGPSDPYNSIACLWAHTMLPDSEKNYCIPPEQSNCAKFPYPASESSYRYEYCKDKCLAGPIPRDVFQAPLVSCTVKTPVGWN